MKFIILELTDDNRAFIDMILQENPNLSRDQLFNEMIEDLRLDLEYIDDKEESSN